MDVARLPLGTRTLWLPIAAALILLALLFAPTTRASSSALEHAARTQVVVRFAAGLGPARRQAILARAGVRRVDDLSRLHSVVGQVAPNERAAAVASLREQRGVVAAAPDAIAHAALVPSDPFFASWSWPATTSGLESAWNVTLGKPNVTIAVVDTGVTPLPDLQGALVPGVDLVDDTGSTADPNGHGTEVASVAAARIDNGLGIAGVCGGCSVMPVRVLDANGNGLMSTVASGVTWAVDHGAQIVNLSLAGSQDDPALDAAIAYAAAHNVLVVVAAGNGGSSDPAHDGYPAAASPTALRVAGADEAGTLFSWSNRGSWVDLAAPGSTSALMPTGAVFLGLQGTSMAAPFVAGTAGLLLSYAPTLSPAGVKQDIVSSGRAASLDTGSGKLLDAYAALEAAGYQPPAAAPAGGERPGAASQPR